MGEKIWQKIKRVYDRFRSEKEYHSFDRFQHLLYNYTITIF